MIKMNGSMNGFVIDDKMPVINPNYGKPISIGKNLEEMLNTAFYFADSIKKKNNNEDVWYRELGRAIEYFYDRDGYLDISVNGQDKLEELIEEFYKIERSNTNASKG